MSPCLTPTRRRMATKSMQGTVSVPSLRGRGGKQHGGAWHDGRAGQQTSNADNTCWWPLSWAAVRLSHIPHHAAEDALLRCRRSHRGGRCTSDAGPGCEWVPAPPSVRGDSESDAAGDLHARGSPLSNSDRRRGVVTGLTRAVFCHRQATHNFCTFCRGAQVGLGRRGSCRDGAP